MRRVLSSLVGMALVLSIAPVGVRAASGVPFSGTWTSIDVDGSVQYISVRRSATPAVTLVDTYASYCAKHGALSTFFVATGVGTFSGSTVLKVKVGRAACESFKVPLSIFAGLTYTHSVATNTLTDNFGLVWHPYPAAAARQLAGNAIAVYQGDAGIRAMLQFEVQVGPAGDVQYGFYRYEGMTPGLFRAQATIESVRFFTDASGAAAADFTGKECNLSPTADPAYPTGACRWYHVVVTDGSRIGAPDTFCGGTDVGNPSACPYRYDITGGDIRIYG